MSAGIHGDGSCTGRSSGNYNLTHTGGPAVRRSFVIVKPESYLGRSYVGSFTNGSHVGKDGRRVSESGLYREYAIAPSSVHDGISLCRQTAELNHYFSEYEAESDDAEQHLSIEGEEDLEDALAMMVIEEDDEQYMNPYYTEEPLEQQYVETVDEAGRPIQIPLSNISQEPGSYGAIDYEAYYAQNSQDDYDEFDGGSTCQGLFQILGCIPAVILGLLMNVLDALSYGMIIFPISEPVFSQLGPTGLSLFYVSTVVSQLVFSGGTSKFKTGIGSEMIEVTPFFHTMALSILNSLPEGNDEVVITTTLVCYAISTIIIGLTFLLLGKLNLGKLVGFFPRHILIGCIGGVAYFLIITGIEVTTRVESFEYSWVFFHRLFNRDDLFAKWALPVALASLLLVLQHIVHHPLLLPGFYLFVFCLFYFIVALVPTLSLELLREQGWVFQVPSTRERWFDFYKLYNPENIDWGLVHKQIPTMLALTFFGILHVPINVPALAISCNVDKYDIDRELSAHGYSNLFSGLLGSVPNYLVYTNSVLFIRAGANNALPGLLLAVATVFVMVAGPDSISFVPIPIVGSLIFLLGYELLKEVFYDTRGKLSRFEYITIVIIVVNMGVFDFVIGIIVGILIACFSYLIDSSKLQTVNGVFDGKVAKSTVYRDYLQTKFLDKIGEQIYVLKLQNILFFGTIVFIEKRIEQLFDGGSERKRIRYFILDFKNIRADHIDYSAAEGFNRIKRAMEMRCITLIISSITEHDCIYKAFNKVGLLDGVELFSDLNSALEWCENEYLVRYKELLDRSRYMKLKRREGQIKNEIYHYPPQTNTPRKSQLINVAQNMLQDERKASQITSLYKTKQPFLPILLLALKTFRPKVLSNDKHEIILWKQLCPYFKPTRLAPSAPISTRGNSFFVLESGVVKVLYQLPHGSIYESLSGNTCYPLNDEVPGAMISKIHAETDCLVWVIDSASLQRLKTDNLKVYTELQTVSMAVMQYRFRSILGYALISS
ncbi:HCL304Cp [Eremothecium sinecaudum]|uniref:HCL304Cp n=1 Tax=Eremothecium sinecaudum TaxID=45286 RepID=A0A120K1Y1_9SACH|nr:HCL304Cp [Eremothecium sinecaudum]AMD19847.1 HCL304Cp [Eremothecium sinecaudum]